MEEKKLKKKFNEKFFKRILNNNIKLLKEENSKKVKININNNKNEKITINNNINNDYENTNTTKGNSNSLVFNSPYLSKKKVNDYNGLCYELKILEIELHRRNRIKNSKKVNIMDEIESEIDVMKEKLEINDFGYDFNNISEIFNIIEIFKSPPEKRRMIDLLKIVKYLTSTKLGQYFKEEFEQKEIFEKLITFCGVEMRYKFFKKGEIVFRIGDLPDYFYLILFGKVDILKPVQKKIILTGYKYFCYLMDLKRKNENYLLNLCIKENVRDFYIEKEVVRDIDYIYLLILVDKISRYKNVNFEKALNITGITCEELDLDVNKIYSNKYLLDNIKKIKSRLPDIEGSIIQKYYFFDDKLVKKEIAIYDYYTFLSLEEKSYFGDSAMDISSTRNATIIASEDTHLALIDNNLYYTNVVTEKAVIIEKKINFLNSNFIFRKIETKKFEKKYFSYFIREKYKKGDIIFNEGDLPYNVYFIEQGDIELYSSRNIIEFQKIIDFLEKEKKTILKAKSLEVEEKDSINIEYTYDKIKYNFIELRKQINKKEKNRILLLRKNEDIGILSFYFGCPYITSCVVTSSFAKLYKIENKYLSDLIMKEKEIYMDLINRVENKLFLFHERFFNINNTKLLLAGHKKQIEQNEINEQISNTNSKIKNINNRNSYNFYDSKSNFNSTNRNFNKTNMKVNFNKLKELFNKSLYVSKSLDNYYANKNSNNYNSEQKKIKLLKGDLPLINSQKTLDSKNSVDKILSKKANKFRNNVNLKKK